MQQMILIAVLYFRLVSCFICPDHGRYPDDSVEDCRGYIVCTASTSDRELMLKFICPINSVFNSVTSKCESESIYKCKESSDYSFDANLLRTESSLFTNIADSEFKEYEDASENIAERITTTIDFSDIYSSINLYNDLSNLSEDYLDISTVDTDEIGSTTVSNGTLEDSEFEEGYITENISEKTATTTDFSNIYTSTNLYSDLSIITSNGSEESLDKSTIDPNEIASTIIYKRTFEDSEFKEGYEDYIPENITERITITTDFSDIYTSTSSYNDLLITTSNLSKEYSDNIIIYTDEIAYTPVNKKTLEDSKFEKGYEDYIYESSSEKTAATTDFSDIYTSTNLYSDLSITTSNGSEESVDKSTIDPNEIVSTIVNNRTLEDSEFKEGYEDYIPENITERITITTDFSNIYTSTNLYSDLSITTSNWSEESLDKSTIDPNEITSTIIYKRTFEDLEFEGEYEDYIPENNAERITTTTNFSDIYTSTSSYNDLLITTSNGSKEYLDISTVDPNEIDSIVVNNTTLEDSEFKEEYEDYISEKTATITEFSDIIIYTSTNSYSDFLITASNGSEESFDNNTIDPDDIVSTVINKRIFDNLNRENNINEDVVNGWNNFLDTSENIVENFTEINSFISRSEMSTEIWNGKISSENITSNFLFDTTSSFVETTESTKVEEITEIMETSLNKNDYFEVSENVIEGSTMKLSEVNYFIDDENAEHFPEKNFQPTITIDNFVEENDEKNTVSESISTTEIYTTIPMDFDVVYDDITESTTNDDYSFSEDKMTNDIFNVTFESETEPLIKFFETDQLPEVTERIDSNTVDIDYVEEKVETRIGETDLDIFGTSKSPEITKTTLDIPTPDILTVTENTETDLMTTTTVTTISNLEDYTTTTFDTKQFVFTDNIVFIEDENSVTTEIINKQDKTTESNTIISYITFPESSKESFTADLFSIESQTTDNQINEKEYSVQYRIIDASTTAVYHEFSPILNSNFTSTSVTEESTIIPNAIENIDNENTITYSSDSDDDFFVEILPPNFDSQETDLSEADIETEAKNFVLTTDELEEDPTTNDVNSKIEQFTFQIPIITSFQTSKDIDTNFSETTSNPLEKNNRTNTDTKLSTTIQTTSNETTIKSQTELITITTPISNNHFNCPSDGRYPDHSIPNCKGYIVCALNSNGQFFKYRYKCLLNSTFDPNIFQCSNDYVCPFITTTFTEEILTKASLPNTSSTTTTTTTTATTTVIGTNITASTATTVFANLIGSTTQSIFNALHITTVSQNSQSFQCSTVGRFPNPNSVNCTGYILCTNSGNANFSQYNFKCAPPSVFDPYSNQCSLTYSCFKKTPASLINTTPSTLIEFLCTSEGRFLDDSIPGCKGYILCSTLSNGTYIKLKFLCLGNTTFDQRSKLCIENNTCYQRITHLTSITTLSPSNGKPFECISSGRFPDYTKSNCVGYILCNYSVSSGTFMQFHFSCHLPSKFDPGLRQCNLNYNCPESEQIISEKLTTLNVSSTTNITPIYTKNTIINSTVENFLFLTTTVSSHKPFTCNFAGRFENQTDQSCKSYIVCVALSAGQFKKYDYKCFGNTVFDPKLKMCSTTYLCVY